ncbi:MAG: ATP-dependent DNA helicase RecG, partial [Rhodomicrobium sp.]|nr:ATP-dependent DNA helicase RecG [Rhodomicrobium sp.]
MKPDQDTDNTPRQNAGRGLRPEVLNGLFADIGTLEGVGPRYKSLLAKLLSPAYGGEPRIIDLLWHLPTGLTDRRASPAIADIGQGELVTILARVKKHFPSPPRNSRAPYRVICEDETGEIALVFFHVERAYIERQLPVGEMRLLSGRVERYGQKLQMPHPDYILPEDQRDRLPKIEPVYPLSQGLNQKFMFKIFSQALARVPEVPEWLDRRLIEGRGWPSFGEALRLLHRPGDDGDMAETGDARMRLACDELFAG